MAEKQYAKKGKLVVVSGFSGVGKGTVVKELMAAHEDEYYISVSATTRGPRVGEENGREYHFISEAEFLEMISNNQLIEHAVYCDNHYGTPRKYVEDEMAKGKNVILEIEIQGARQIRSQYPDAVLVFIMPPDAPTLYQRLKGRGTETDDKVNARMQTAVKEAEGIELYDYIFVNDVAADCAERINTLVEALSAKTVNNSEFIEDIRTELKSYVKGDK